MNTWKRKPKPGDWRQISGDVDPGSYGAIIARFDGAGVELLEIQPVREYVGDSEALEVGFPFWTKAAWYDAAELENHSDMEAAMQCVGLSRAELTDFTVESERHLALAECLFRYGSSVEPGDRDGWAKDALGAEKVFWWAAPNPQGWRFLSCEDREFRALQKECAP